MSGTVRDVRSEDLSEILRIEKEITGSRQMEILEELLRHYLDRGDPDLLLAAESEGQLVGFLMGEIRPWEFGEDEKVAWIKIVGVDPHHQGHGIGKQLGEEFVNRLQSRGIHRLRTLVPWDSGDLITYFQALGFDRSHFIVLERAV